MLLEEAEIIVAELASNAVMHARSPFRVSISANEVRDQDRGAATHRPCRPEKPAELWPSWPGHPGGRGISIVASLSLTWDTEPEADGKTDLGDDDPVRLDPSVRSVAWGAGWLRSGRRRDRGP